MKKIVLTASTVVLAALLGAPGWVGSLAKDRLDDALAKMSTGNISVAWKSYEQGWFRSEGTLRAVVNIPPGPDGPAVRFPIQYRVALNHGPVIFANGLQFGWASWNSTMTSVSELTASLGAPLAPEDQPTVVQKGLINLIGNINFSDQISAFSASG